jgi:hypothetical protein
MCAPKFRVRILSFLVFFRQDKGIKIFQVQNVTNLEDFPKTWKNLLTHRQLLWEYKSLEYKNLNGANSSN